MVNRTTSISSCSLRCLSSYQVPEATPTSTEAITSCNPLLVSCGAIFGDSRVDFFSDENQYKHPQ